MGRRACCRAIRTSYTYRVPVASLIAERLQVSLPLALYALLLGGGGGISAWAFAAAARRGRASDAALTGFTQLGLAVPNFWLGMLLVMVFAIGLHVASAGGFPGWNAGFWPALRALTLPAVALAMPQAAILARVLRGALIEPFTRITSVPRGPKARASAGSYGATRCPMRSFRC